MNPRLTPAASFLNQPFTCAYQQVAGREHASPTPGTARDYFAGTGTFAAITKTCPLDGYARHSRGRITAGVLVFVTGILAQSTVYAAVGVAACMLGAALGATFQLDRAKSVLSWAHDPCMLVTGLLDASVYALSIVLMAQWAAGIIKGRLG